MMPFQKRRNRRTVQFSPVVQVREYALAVGDMALCMTTPYCPRMCRSHLLPLTLTNRIVRTYHTALRETPSAPLVLPTCKSQMKRLMQCPGSKEDRMSVLTQLNMDLQQLHHASQALSPIWDEKTLQARLGCNDNTLTPVRIECLDDDDKEAQRIARPSDNPVIQLAIVKAVVASGDKCPAEMYIHLQSSQSNSKASARNKALALQGELYGRFGLSVRTKNHQEWRANSKRQMVKGKKKEKHASSSAGLENILPLPKVSCCGRKVGTKYHPLC